MPTITGYQGETVMFDDDYDEYDDFVHKCKRDALRNSESISETTNPITSKPILTPQTFTDKYKLPLIILSIIIVLLIISIIVYHTYFNTN